MKDRKTMVALDCGNSSFRVVLGQYRDGKIESTVINQFPNEMVRIGDYFYWDFLLIFRQFKESLRKIVKQGKHIDSIGICTWGVDFGLFDKDGNLLSNPLSYRNSIGEEVLSGLEEEQRSRLFYQTGILCDKINSLYMMTGMKRYFPEFVSAADRCLMIPDILNYFMTGVMVNEPSELSTTQLMNAKERTVDKDVCEQFGIPTSWFGEIACHGKKIGMVREDILKEIGADYDIPVVCVPSHDTASAVAAIPAAEDSFGFVSCGTWSLIGTELEEPVCNETVKEAELTNEVGAFGRITLLKNSSGMFIVNRLKKEYDYSRGVKSSWDEITEMAQSCDSSAVIDLNDNAFFNPESMSEAVWEYLVRTKQTKGDLKWPVLFKTFYESLACCYAVTLRDIEQITGKTFEKVYIVGGGASSRVLIDLTAQHTGKPVIVCYGESTAMGNLAVQLKYFDQNLTLEDIRKIISVSYKTEEFAVCTDRPEVLKKYEIITGRRENEEPADQ